MGIVSVKLYFYYRVLISLIEYQLKNLVIYTLMKFILLPQEFVVTIDKIDNTCIFYM